jgi:hypothetical protein
VFSAHGRTEWRSTHNPNWQKIYHTATLLTYLLVLFGLVVCVFKLMRTQQVLQKLWRLQPTRIYHTATLLTYLLVLFSLVWFCVFSNSWELNKCYRSFEDCNQLESAKTLMVGLSSWSGWWSFAALLDQHQ